MRGADATGCVRVYEHRRSIRLAWRRGWDGAWGGLMSSRDRRVELCRGKGGKEKPGGALEAVLWETRGRNRDEIYEVSSQPM